DFAGREGSDVLAVASGVVVWSGERHGYGQLVEINHGNGYVTRYAHNSNNLVSVGDTVKRGQVIARLGDTGRATGPNLPLDVRSDFAGREGSDVLAVASGVVVWSGERHGYGQLVEINHGNGYVTRYAHNSNNLVSVGDTVKRGQVIARLGDTGRATGPNLHFEV